MLRSLVGSEMCIRDRYWCVRPLATCTVWVAIDPSSQKNGCLQVVPGSHRAQRLLPHRTHNDPAQFALQQEVHPTEYNRADVVNLVLEPGQISLHDVYLVHGSRKNDSDVSRRGMTMRFFPTSSVYRRDLPDPALRGVSSLPVFLMTGTDLTNGRTHFGLVPEQQKPPTQSELIKI
eukprot:TRINITY_DN9178_c0_g1_i2.p1 TRINITY_DN9178_c0_g1~~TRINITY_DN9178_c0_g1_i2.p1  ORF type:complete len:176 (+),score=32.28 TRINITY_DN9178_c0_g1_i2:108-635(+)